VLDAVTATPSEIRHALLAVLQDPACRAAAEAVRAEVAALPGPERAAELLEGLVVPDR
jgi:UDP:flavonoid glycosyltransferase YjiC (YdhE family)